MPKVKSSSQTQLIPLPPPFSPMTQPSPTLSMPTTSPPRPTTPRTPRAQSPRASSQGRRISCTTDDIRLVSNPDRMVQELIVSKMSRRHEILNSIRGVEIQLPGNSKGVFRGATSNGGIFELTDGVRKELPLTETRVRQLCTTTR